MNRYHVTGDTQEREQYLRTADDMSNDCNFEDEDEDEDEDEHVDQDQDQDDLCNSFEIYVCVLHSQ